MRRQQMVEASPFLHRDQRKMPAYVPSVRSAQDAFDRERAKQTLELLRYRWWARRGTLGSFMQRLGDWGREHFYNPSKWNGRTWW